MEFAELSWMDVEDYLQRDDRVILPVGTTEQHGYLSLLTDVRIPMALANAASVRTQALVAPPLNFGVSPYFMDFPGTLSLSEATFHQVVYELVMDLVEHGFRRILILNGHSGNTRPPQLDGLQDEVDGLRIVWYEWYNAPAAEAFMAREGLPLEHANWCEAFPFTRVGALPQGEKKRVNLPFDATAETARALLGDGSFGGPYQAPDETMARLFDTLLADVLDVMESM